MIFLEELQRKNNSNSRPRLGFELKAQAFDDRPGRYGDSVNSFHNMTIHETRYIKQ
jgi:hypothetical protein